MYHTRVCEQLIERTAASFPCIVVYGPRQVGKSTTIHHLFKDFCPMITLDDRSDRDLALTDSSKHMAGLWSSMRSKKRPSCSMKSRSKLMPNA